MPTNTWHFVDFLVSIDEATQQLLYAHLYDFTRIGLNWLGWLAAMMIVACGINGVWRCYDWGQVAERFKSLIIGFAIPFAMLQFYATPIPQTGMTFPQTINQTSLQYSQMITTGLAEDLMTDFELTEASLETPDWYDVDGLLAYALVTIAVLIAEAAAFCVMVFGHVGQGIAVLVGPLFIPWMIIPRFNRIFFGWLMVFIGFALYPIVAAGVMEMIANVGSHMFVFNGQTGVLTEILATPVIFVVSIALIYAIFKIPAMSHMLVSGVGHSDFGELLAGFVLRAFL